MDVFIIYLISGVISALLILFSAITSRRKAIKEIKKHLSMQEAPFKEPYKQSTPSTVSGITSGESKLLLESTRNVIRKLSSPLIIGLDEISSLRTRTLRGLVSGYGCVDSRTFKANLSRLVAPSGFEGSWECCLLGCGGLSCAYLCSRGDEKIVFKVPRGLESIIEEIGEMPTIHMGAAERTKREAEIVAKLEHPNILRLLGASENVPLLVYEYADNGTLYWQLKNGWKPSLRDIVLLGIQLGDALRYIHSRGMIHGDVKPGNIYIKGGVSKLGDFSSIAKLITLTSIREIPYTIGYRTPEQVYSEIAKRAKEFGLENRIDIYQLGNTLLYLLIGETIDGEEAVNEKIVRERLEKIQNNELRIIIERMLALEPERRPSAEELVKLLYEVWNSLSEK